MTDSCTHASSPHREHYALCNTLHAPLIAEHSSHTIHQNIILHTSHTIQHTPHIIQYTPHSIIRLIPHNSQHTQYTVHSIQHITYTIQQNTPSSRMTGCRIRKWQLPTLPPGGAVPSAMVSLTSLFGMGRGGSSPL